MKNSRRGQEGIALLFVVFAFVVILGAITIVAIQIYGAQRTTDASLRSAMLDEACKAGVDIGIELLWNAYVQSRGGSPGPLNTYQEFLMNHPDWMDGDAPWEVGEPIIPYDFGVGGVQITDLTITRVGDPTGFDFVIDVRAEAAGEARAATQTVRISGAQFQGFQYAVLANNVNCIMCHAEVTSLGMTLNTDPDLYGTFDRVKVASLQSLLFRLNTADSRVAGTLYTRGNVLDEHGNPVSAAQLSSSTLRGYRFCPSTGYIEQDEAGQPFQTPLEDADRDENGVPEPRANLYKDYPLDPSLQSDGMLPDIFPAPFPDLNENRLVDDDEFELISNTLGGSIQGGVVYGVPQGDLYEAAELPASSNEALTQLANSSVYDGNLILVGTDANPIVLDGDVAINGDLVLHGKVKGWGRLMVRGNTYITGDVTYADAPGQFGVAADGTENGLAVVSGGSILMGDYLTIRGKNHTQNTDKYPNSSYSAQVRQAHKTRDWTLDGVTQTMQYGYFDPGMVDPGGIFPTMIDNNGNEVPRTGQQFSFTQSELMLFNILELEKAVADPNYTPRFYGLRDSQPDSVYIYHKPPDEHAVRYDESGGGVQLLPEFMISQGYPLEILDRATFHYMNPSSNWISEDTLRQIWWNDEQQRPSSGAPFRFDGLLYSNNAIFQIVRSRVRHGSYTDGKMHIRGAVIAPDLGVLAPGSDKVGDKSFYLLYVQRFMELEDTTRVSFRRRVFRFRPAS